MGNTSVAEIKGAVKAFEKGNKLSAKQEGILNALEDVAKSLEEAANNEHPEFYDFEQTLLDNDIQAKLDAGEINIGDIDDALDDYDDNIGMGGELSGKELDDFWGLSNEETKSDGGVKGDQKTELTSYTEAELAEREREQKQRDKQDTETELNKEPDNKTPKSEHDQADVSKKGENVDTLEGVADKADALYSKSGPSEDVDFAHEILTELSEVDDMFRYPISESSTLQGVMKDVAPTFRYIGEDTHLDEQEDFGAEKKLLFKNEQGKPFDIYVRGNELWIDVSRFNTGEGGAAVYAAVGNYALNTGNVFIADPHSLSDDAAIRRTSAMLSLALRFGRTDFMEPGPKQLQGIPELGVKPLKWTGNDVDRTKALIDTFLSNLEYSMPELKNVRYDFNKRDFLRRDNDLPVDWSTVYEARVRGFGEAARAGEATARRGVFIRSLISSESSQRPGILEQVLNGSRSLVKNGNLERVFSKSTPTTGSTVAQVKKLLPARVAKLVASGKLEVVQDGKDAPATATSFDAGGIEGYYDASADKLYIIAVHPHGCGEHGWLSSTHLA